MYQAANTSVPDKHVLLAEKVKAWLHDQQQSWDRRVSLDKFEAECATELRPNLQLLATNVC
jgi:hypothetical protein